LNEWQLEPEKLTEEALKEKFTGKNHSVHLCPDDSGKCPITGKEPKFEGAQLHVMITPYTTYGKDQHAWYRPSKTMKSVYGVWLKALKELGFLEGVKTKEQMIQKLEGAVFEYEDQLVQVGFSDRKTSGWIPAKWVKEQAKIAELEASKPKPTAAEEKGGEAVVETEL